MIYIYFCLNKISIFFFFISSPPSIESKIHQLENENMKSGEGHVERMRIRKSRKEIPIQRMTKQKSALKIL